MLHHNPGGVSLSTDEYFCHQGDYCYDPLELGTAHEWNQQRGMKTNTLSLQSKTKTPEKNTQESHETIVDKF